MTILPKHKILNKALVIIYNNKRDTHQKTIINSIMCNNTIGSSICNVKNKFQFLTLFNSNWPNLIK